MVEAWLQRLVEGMQGTMKAVIKRAASNVNEMALADFLFGHPAQVALLGLQFQWTADMQARAAPRMPSSQGRPAACRLTEAPLPCTSLRRQRSAPPFDYGEACPSNTPPTTMPARRSRPGTPRTPLAGSPRRRRAQVALATAKTDKGAVTRAARKAEALLREMVAITLRQDLTRIQRISLETCITVHMHQKESSGTQPSPQSRAARSANPISILTLRTTAPSLVLLPAPSCSAMCRARSDSTALQLQRAGDAQRSW